MKLRTLTILILVTTFLSNTKAQRTIYIEGHITATETGLPVPMKELTFWEANGMVVAIANTDQSGYYMVQMNLTTSDTSSFVYASVTDCSQSVQVQEIPINTQAYYTADFVICTLTDICQAAFSYQPHPANQLLIGFENLSFPVSYSTFWFWDFGDGQTSTDFEPVHEYAQPGIYTVCLTMVDSMAGCTSVFCQDVLVDINQSDCEAYFSWDPQGLTIAFTDLSTGFPDSYFWDFGDGTSSTEQNPMHTWTVPGAYQVCLSIFNDSTQCQSSYCELIVAGDEPPDCHASFSYQQIEGNTYSFNNESTGMILEYIWDFGDGTTAYNVANPVHTWQQPGIYQVCLAVNGIYCSDVTCTDITVGDTISACQAAFTAMADSIPGNINHYWFMDKSTGVNITSWYWDFGDGTTSYIQNPDYTFAESGTYEVCLTTSGQGNGGYCSSTICQTITTPAYSNLGGQIFAGNFPINNPDFINDVARVTLFRKTGTKLSEVASGLYYEYGYYFFLDVMEGNYVVHTGLVEGSPSYMSYIPAYTGSTHSWQSAQPVTLQGVDVFDANVYMQGMTILPETGTGVISGNLVSLDNTLVDLGGKIIFLFQDGVIVDYVHTGDNGSFSFNTLPLTAFSISAEIAGQYSNTIQVNLNEYQSQAIGIQLELSSSGVFGFEDQPVAEGSTIHLFPNPVGDLINLRISTEIAGDCTFRILSSTGTVLKEFSANLQAGDNLITTNAGNLSSGLYLINCSDEKDYRLRSARFIKK
jgi:PKD repeat protein